MRRRTQTTRTNHHILGYGVGSSRKILDGALARVATAECLQANKTNAFTRFALTLFRLLCFCFGTVKAALKAAAAIIITRPPDRGGAPHAFQLQVKFDGATVMLEAGSAWTAADVKAALHAKTGRAIAGYYLVAAGGKPLDDGAATTLAALGVGPGDRLELRGRLRGGMGCGASKGPAAWLLAKRSYWDEVGDGKPNASALKRALADTVLVDAAWLARLADPQAKCR